MTRDEIESNELRRLINLYSLDHNLFRLIEVFKLLKIILARHDLLNKYTSNLKLDVRKYGSTIRDFNDFIDNE